MWDWRGGGGRGGRGVEPRRYPFRAACRSTSSGWPRRRRRDGDGFVVDGEKYYSTGGLYASWFTGSAVDPDGTVLGFTVPVDRPGVERLDDFDAIGQRLTASGTTRLTGVRVAADELTRTLTGVQDDHPLFPALLAAVSSKLTA